MLYFDPDMVLFSRVDDILATLETSNLALTPHQTKPEQTLDAIFDNEVASLKHGIFNLGFIGVRNTAEGRRFADWWAERTYHLCWADVENGLFTDQKWVNFAPVFFDGVAIIKSSRHNVATWNLTTRRMTGTLRHRFRSRRRAARLLPFHGIRQRRAPDHGHQECVGEPRGAGAHHLVRRGDRDRGPRSRSANGRGRSGASRTGRPSRPAIAGSIAIIEDLQRAFPEPYDAGTDRMSYLGWCRTEGRVRYPELFAEGGARRAPKPARLGSRVSLPMALRLFGLMLSPKGGKALRERCRMVFRREGFGGFARRLHGPRG